mmetsp:Transcript_4451/g.7922  ORF Transcript_4451/g.7922 Transcript_4451/m.7922 type:complete len:146 (-) Transcript_4451:327-764(-)
MCRSLALAGRQRTVRFARSLVALSATAQIHTATDSFTAGWCVNKHFTRSIQHFVYEDNLHWTRKEKLSVLRNGSFRYGSLQEVYHEHNGLEQENLLNASGAWELDDLSEVLILNGTSSLDAQPFQRRFSKTTMLSWDAEEIHDAT